MNRGQCLRDVVKLRQFCTSDVNALTSGPFINDLPGVEGSDFELLTDTDDPTGQAVWEKIQRDGLNAFYGLVAGRLNQVQTRTEISRTNTGSWEQPFVDQALTTTLKGYVFDLRGSDNLELRLLSAQLFVGNGPKDIILYVYDLETGAELGQVAGTVNASGFAFFLIDSTAYMGRRIFVGYDGAVIESRDINPNGESWYQDRCSCRGASLLGVQCASLENADPKIYDNLSFDECPGMILNFAMGCTIENWLCEHKDGLASALLFHLGKRFFLEVLASDRINRATLIEQERFQKLVNYCDEEFEKSFSSYMDGIEINDPICFKCKTPVQVRVINV